jgi:hypothetical protein
MLALLVAFKMIFFIKWQEAAIVQQLHFVFRFQNEPQAASVEQFYDNHKCVNVVSHGYSVVKRGQTSSISYLILLSSQTDFMA